MSSIYVEESTGSDETGKGTQESPYQTLAFALFSHPGASVLIRKDATGTYEEPTQSSLKKAKKGAEGMARCRSSKAISGAASDWQVATPAELDRADT